MKKMNNKGISLVELIIVIAIMAILVGVLAPQFIKYVEQSRESADLQTIEEIKTAIETWTADTGAATGTTTVTATGAAKTAVVAGTAAGQLADYGVSDSTSLKSERVIVTWTYDHASYKWSLTNDGMTGGNALYTASGSKK